MTETIAAAPAGEALASAPSEAPPSLVNTPVEAAAAEAPPAEPAKPAEGEALPFALDQVTLPEGLVIPDEVGGKFTELVNSNKIPKEAAQGLLDLYASQIKSQVDAGAQLWQQTNDQWQAEIKADPAIGGAKLPQTLASIAKLIDHPDFADPGLRAAMDLTGAGNNPAIVRLLHKLSTKFTEGGYTAGSPPGSIPAKPTSLGEAFYGSNSKG